MNFSFGFMFKAVISLVGSLLGMYYLASGKKTQDFQKMVIGAVLIIGSMFIF
jgi:hypothetical protein